MSSSRQIAVYDVEKTSKDRCVSCLCISWKVLQCVFTHFTLVASVIAYCILGAFTFEHLERDNEIEVRKQIEKIRNNVTENIWVLTKESKVLHEMNWTNDVAGVLSSFESELLKQIKDNGWDGKEVDNGNYQWAWSGALFYSIIVITTIGYGHIAPRTTMGKIATIFYAIAGIPLMLLCLSNIGDIMASSFRFLYWRVCCYVCTREPKRKRHRSRSGYHPRSSGRSIQPSQRSMDSGYPQPEGLFHSYSDPDCRYVGEKDLKMHPYKYYSETTPRSHSQRVERNREPGMPYRKNRHTIEREHHVDRMYRREFPNERRARSTYRQEMIEPPINSKEPPMFYNRYAEEKLAGRGRHQPRSKSMPKYAKHFSDPHESSNADSPRPERAVNDDERRYRRKDRPVPSSSARIMSPMGFAVHRQAKHLAQMMETNEEWNQKSNDMSPLVRPVPIWLCVFLVVGYILGGAYLFSRWENWSLLDSAYFCFITLTTIGFGDFVPAQKETENAKESIAKCSLYLLFGIALLAMSFNLVQEEVIANVKSVARRLGIIKEEEEYYD